MRKDATIDRKLVKLSNASTLGHGKWKAQFGDMIQYNENHSRPDDPVNFRIGRVIGRIDFAPALEGDKEHVKDWLLVAAFADDLTFVYERWVRPESVLRCWTPQEKQSKLWAFMLGEDFKKHTSDELREWSESGFCNWEDFQAWKDKR